MSEAMKKFTSTSSVESSLITQPKGISSAVNSNIFMKNDGNSQQAQNSILRSKFGPTQISEVIKGSNINFNSQINNTGINKAISNLEKV